MQSPTNIFVDELIRQLRYTSGVLVAPEIQQKKVFNAISKNSYSGTDPIIGLIDCTVFGSAKENIMFTTSGIYWNHASSIPNSGSLAYASFGTCFFKSAGIFAPFSISTGMGQTINTNGSSVTKKDLIQLLSNIKNLSVSQGLMPQPATGIESGIPNSGVVQQQAKSNAELLALAHNMSEAKNWDAAIKAYEDANEYRMAGLVREQQAQWNRSHRN